MQRVRRQFSDKDYSHGLRSWEDVFGGPSGHDMKRDGKPQQPMHHGAHSSMWSRAMRTPMLIIVLAALACNVLAFVFFYNVDHTLPRGGVSSITHSHQQLEQHNSDFELRDGSSGTGDATSLPARHGLSDAAGNVAQSGSTARRKQQQHGALPHPPMVARDTRDNLEAGGALTDGHGAGGIVHPDDDTTADILTALAIRQAGQGGKAGAHGSATTGTDPATTQETGSEEKKAAAAMARAIHEAKQMLTAKQGPVPGTQEGAAGGDAAGGAAGGDGAGGSAGGDAAGTGDAAGGGAGGAKDEDQVAQHLKDATDKWRQRLAKISGTMSGIGMGKRGLWQSASVKHHIHKKVQTSESKVSAGSESKAAIPPGMEEVEVIEEVEVMTTLSDPNVQFPDPAIVANQTDWPIWWFAPFFDRTSFGQEAATLVLGMMRSGAVPEENIWVGTTQGDCNYGVDDSMPRANFDQLDAANQRWNMSYAAIAVCHSLPPFWSRPKNKWDSCFPCPPIGYTPAITIGRAMAETDIYHEEFVKHCNRMDEVWVPSDFSRDVLIKSGVEAPKLRIVPIAVNTTLFDPDAITGIKLPIGDLVFGQHKRPMPPPAPSPPPAPPPSTPTEEAETDSETDDTEDSEEEEEEGSEEEGEDEDGPPGAAGVEGQQEQDSGSATDTKQKLAARRGKERAGGAAAEEEEEGGRGTEGMERTDGAGGKAQAGRGAKGKAAAGTGAGRGGSLIGAGVQGLAGVSTGGGSGVGAVSPPPPLKGAAGEAWLAARKALTGGRTLNAAGELEDVDNALGAGAGTEEEGAGDDGLLEGAGRQLQAKLSDVKDGWQKYAGGAEGGVGRRGQTAQRPHGADDGADGDAEAAEGAEGQDDGGGLGSNAGRAGGTESMSGRGTEDGNDPAGQDAGGSEAMSGEDTDGAATGTARRFLTVKSHFGGAEAARFSAEAEARAGAGAKGGSASEKKSTGSTLGRLGSWAAGRLTGSKTGGEKEKRKPFVLLSCFKWEMRKGWDVLLASYLQEFTSDDNVELYILTKPFLTGNNFVGDMHDWVNKHLNITAEQHKRLPTLYVISSHLTDAQYAGLYKAADAFVIATRGEGWGMPISEAMSMGLPVVVTNWSGVTGFVDESTGYMVDYKLSKVPYDQPWWFRGARWADAKVESMRSRLREVVSNRREAARRGRRARERMVTKYSPEALGFALGKEFARLKDLLRSGKKCGSKCHNKTWVAPLGDRRADLYSGNEPFIVANDQPVVQHGQVATNALALSGMGALNVHSMVAAANAAGVQRADAWKQIIASVGSGQIPPIRAIVTEPDPEHDKDEGEEEEEEEGAETDTTDAATDSTDSTNPPGTPPSPPSKRSKKHKKKKAAAAAAKAGGSGQVAARQAADDALEAAVAAATTAAAQLAAGQLVAEKLAAGKKLTAEELAADQAAEEAAKKEVLEKERQFFELQKRLQQQTVQEQQRRQQLGSGGAEGAAGGEEEEGQKGSVHGRGLVGGGAAGHEWAQAGHVDPLSSIAEQQQQQHGGHTTPSKPAAQGLKAMQGKQSTHGKHALPPDEQDVQGKHVEHATKHSSGAHGAKPKTAWAHTHEQRQQQLQQVKQRYRQSTETQQAARRSAAALGAGAADARRGSGVVGGGGGSVLSGAGSHAAGDGGGDGGSAHATQQASDSLVEQGQAEGAQADTDSTTVAQDQLGAPQTDSTTQQQGGGSAHAGTDSATQQQGGSGTGAQELEAGTVPHKKKTKRRIKDVPRHVDEGTAHKNFRDMDPRLQ